VRHRVSRLLVVCLLISIVVHFVAGPLLVRLFGAAAPAQWQPDRIIFVARSSALRITHRTRPMPPRPAPAPVPQPRTAPVQPEQALRPERAYPSVPHVDVTQARPPAAVPPRRTADAVDVTRDEQQFEKTIAQLREHSDPVVGAVRSPVPAEAQRHYSFNVAQDVQSGPRQQGILEPLPGSPWHDGGYDYYYVRYWAEYEDGTTETGIVPWPLRYPPAQDPFRLGLRHIPLPLPLPDYRLPPGTVMHPLVEYCYEHRAQLTSCPIAHA